MGYLVILLGLSCLWDGPAFKYSFTTTIDQAENIWGDQKVYLADLIMFSLWRSITIGTHHMLVAIYD